MAMKPAYDLDKIRFATDAPTYERAIGLYESGKVTKFKEDLYGYFAVVRGGSAYNVYVSRAHYDRGTCACYLGEKDELCKHLVALALYAVVGGRKLTEEEKQTAGVPTASGILGTLDTGALKMMRAEITATLRYIKSYDGPSRTWFAYQNSLDEGCSRFAKLVSNLPVSLQTAQLLVDVLIRLDRKLLQGGVDDSNGTVGGLIENIVEVLIAFHKLDPTCTKAFQSLVGIESCFDWEEPLVALLSEESG